MSSVLTYVLIEFMQATMGRSKSKRKSRNSGEVSENKRQVTMDMYMEKQTEDRDSDCSDISDITEQEESKEQCSKEQENY